MDLILAAEVVAASLIGGGLGFWYAALLFRRRVARAFSAIKHRDSAAIFAAVFNSK
jgi:hypothetical protein